MDGGGAAVEDPSLFLLHIFGIFVDLLISDMSLEKLVWHILITVISIFDAVYNECSLMFLFFILCVRDLKLLFGFEPR